jgi:hypothetical protein
VDEFLRGLLQDLAWRCEAMKERLASIPDDPDTADHALHTYTSLERVLRSASRLASSPDLSNQALLPIYVRQYRRLYEEVSLVEAYLLPFVERYNQQDRLLTGVCRLLAEQVGWPLEPPLVGSFSADYYWTVAEFDVICVPAAEGTSLLGLSDLSHEMGHILMLHYAAQLVGDFMQEVAQYVQQAQTSVVNQQRSPEYVALYDQLLVSWGDEWLQEFVCDMIATYLVGPAYAWQHVRLTAGNGSEVYHPALGETGGHPADEARLRGITAILENMGLTDKVQEVRALWDSYMMVNAQSQPADYDSCYPQYLIDSLANRVHAGCRSIGLVSFTERSSGTISGVTASGGAGSASSPGSTAGGLGASVVQPVKAPDLPTLLNVAWDVFHATPSDYHTWEQAQLTALRQSIGL